MRVPRFRILALMMAVAVVAVVGSFCGLLAGILAPKVVIGLYALDGPDPDATFSPAGWAAWKGLLIGASLGGVVGLLVCLVSRWPRMTTRRWMIAVAVVAVAAGTLVEVMKVSDLAAYYREKSAEHCMWEAVHRESAERFRGLWLKAIEDRDPEYDDYRETREWDRRRVEYHAAMTKKYEQAALNPWLPVPPDPPPPE